MTNAPSDGHLHLDVSNFHSQVNLTILDIMSYYGPIMHSEAYIKALAEMMDAAKKDLANLEVRKTELEDQRVKLVGEIAGKHREIEEIEKLWKRTPLGDKPIGVTTPLLNEKSFTNAIAYVLRTSNQRLFPTDIRDRMAEWGFDIGSYRSDVVASIHTTLRRLHKQGKVNEFNEGHRRNSYEWNRGVDRVAVPT